MFRTRRKLEGRIATLEQQNQTLAEKHLRNLTEKLTLRSELRRLTDERDALIARLVAIAAVLDPPTLTPKPTPTPAE